MKKNGFTLIELLGVVTILAIILMIGTNAVSKIIKENKKHMHDEQMSNFVDAVRIWSADNVNSLPYDGSTITITLETLIVDGLVEDNVIDPLTDEAFPKTTSFCIKNINGSYTYGIGNNC
jgi:prepilin-type N-terminal cleavage/methylation domain-containing protein